MVSIPGPGSTNSAIPARIKANPATTRPMRFMLYSNYGATVDSGIGDHPDSTPEPQGWFQMDDGSVVQDPVLEFGEERMHVV